MYLKQTKTPKGRVYLSVVHGYRDKENKVRTKTIQKIGYLDEFEDKYEDPIKYFKQAISEMKESEADKRTIEDLEGKKITEKNDEGTNLGYIILKSVYNAIGIADLLKTKQKNYKIEYNLNSMFEFLIYSRILNPASKKTTYENKQKFFDNYEFSLKDVYRSLDIFPNFKNEVERTIWENTKTKYRRDTSVSYYDCTNYYFEITNNDEDLIDDEGNFIKKGYRKKGFSKENKRSPIIQLGLLMDNTGIPLTYEVFPGNESEKTSLRPILKKSKTKFGIDRIIVVADRGLNTSDNTVFIAGKNHDQTSLDGYIFGQSIKGGDKEFKKWALNKDDFITDIIEDKDGSKIKFIHKSRIFAKTTKIEKDGKRNQKFDIYQKQMVYYSEKYAKKQKYDRERKIETALELIKSPTKYNKATSRGASAYVKNISFIKETGEIAKDLDLSLDKEKIKEEEKYDGYYSIVTSELKMSDKEIRDRYKGLWEIEETFKITKSILKTRPVYVKTAQHIEAHFLTCFVALVILRLLEKDLKDKYTSRRIINSLKNLTCHHFMYDIYMQNYRDDIIEKLEEVYGIDLSYKFHKLSNIRQKFKKI